MAEWVGGWMLKYGGGQRYMENLCKMVNLLIYLKIG